MFNKFQLEQIKELVISCGTYQVNEQKRLNEFIYEEKALNQLVSHVDIESEKMLVDGLKSITPTAGFLTEEETVNQSEAPERWIIDPLDGTTNYLFGHRQFAISIACQKSKKTAFGCIYLPQDQAYYYSNGQGSYLNDIPIHCSSRTKLQDSLIATGFPYYQFKEIHQYLEILHDLMKLTKGLRRMGSAAIDLAYTAEGKFDGFFELNLSSWDVAAGAFIVQQAGGSVSDFKGDDDYIFGKSILACNAHIQKELIDVIQDKFKFI